MSEAAKVRLVRCPKCHNLLPELTDYSVYQCGGCDAVLRASKMNGELDKFSEKSDEERVGGISEKMENLEFSEKRVMNVRDGFESDVKLNSSSLSRAERSRIMQNSSENRTTANTWVVEEGSEVEKNIDEQSHLRMERESEDLKPQIVDEDGLRRSGKMPNRRTGERREIEGFQRPMRADVERRRFSASKYSEEGPSNYYSDSSFAYGEPSKKRYYESELDNIEYSGDNRAELLRKIDELKVQLSRSGEVVDKPMKNIPNRSRGVHRDPYTGSEEWFSDSSSRGNRPFVQYPVSDQHVTRGSYVNHYTEPTAYMNMMDNRHSFYPPSLPPSRVHGIEDPLRSQMPRRGPQHATASFQEQPIHGYFSRHYMNNRVVHMDPFETYTPNINNHHLSCTCFQCIKKNQVPDDRFSDISNNPMSYHPENRGSFGPHDYGSRKSNLPPFKSHNLQSHTRWPSEVESRVSSFVPRRPQKVQASAGSRHCLALAGGAPFMTCHNCFELLEMPKKVMVQENDQKKLRCGSCSTIIVFGVSNKGLFVSVHEPKKETVSKADNNSKEKLNEGNSQTQSRTTRASMTFSSEDYDHSGYDFQSMDKELVPQLSDQPGSAKSAGMKSLRSTSSCTSEDEVNLDPVAASKKDPNLTQLPIKGKSSPPRAGSSLHVYFDYSDEYHICVGNGNRSRRSDTETSMPKKISSRQNSIKDAAEATEMEIFSNEYPVTSLESGEPSKEGDQLRANKVPDSKKSSRDSNSSKQGAEHEKANVTVNGHLIPDRLVKRAEKLAGPIQPGHYWYDFRAGFWGLMGGPCLGIIPPFIEEFNYPMQENCAGGRTFVFVNGRELHQKDLNLLVSRGLPNERNRSYIVEISGRVLDEGTGEELESLGKLAPTVEREKHGFGMKAPKAAA